MLSASTVASIIIIIAVVDNIDILKLLLLVFSSQTVLVLIPLFIPQNNSISQQPVHWRYHPQILYAPNELWGL
jgi:hypothetical protein